MDVNFSTALRNFIAGHGPWIQGLANGRIYEYAGSMPASADTASTSTLLTVYTLSGGAYTAETRATAVLVLSGSAGSVDTLTAGGAIPIIGSAVTVASLSAGADALASAINDYPSIPKFTAASDGVDTVTISAPVGLGANANGLTLAHTETTTVVTVNGGSSTTFGGTGGTAGVTAVNGINMASPAASGALSRESTIWQGEAVASGTAGWARWVADGSDDGSTGTTYRRMDGDVSTSGAAFTVGSTTRTLGQDYTITTGTITVPSTD